MHSSVAPPLWKAALSAHPAPSRSTLDAGLDHNSQHEKCTVMKMQVRAEQQVQKVLFINKLALYRNCVE